MTTTPGTSAGRPWVASHEIPSTSVAPKQEHTGPLSQSKMGYSAPVSSVSVATPSTPVPKASVHNVPNWTPVTTTSTAQTAAPLNSNPNLGTQPTPVSSDVKLVFESIDISPEELRAKLPRYSIKVST